MSLFPILQPRAADPSGVSGLYVETAWDFEKNRPIYKNGAPVLITGKDAVFVWAYNALQTPRFIYDIFTWDYGNELESLIGKPFTDELKQSEAPRYIRECLMINPYITDVKDITVSFFDSHLEISCTIVTVYGEVKLYV